MRANLLNFFILSIIFLLASCAKESPRVLVFSKTAGFRHESIEAGKVAMLAMAIAPSSEYWIIDGSIKTHSQSITTAAQT